MDPALSSSSASSWLLSEHTASEDRPWRVIAKPCYRGSTKATSAPARQNECLTPAKRPLLSCLHARAKPSGAFTWLRRGFVGAYSPPSPKFPSCVISYAHCAARPQKAPDASPPQQVRIPASRRQRRDAIARRRCASPYLRRDAARGRLPPAAREALPFRSDDPEAAKRARTGAARRPRSLVAGGMPDRTMRRPPRGVSGVRNRRCVVLARAMCAWRICSPPFAASPCTTLQSAVSRAALPGKGGADSPVFLSTCQRRPGALRLRNMKSTSDATSLLVLSRL
ncbi:hypothetical protein PsYK624_094100 [Phanerochaete sordida]|uniref:Uncharacterized protein n=1 Tax=Phanerochaete sordida TaxID=48140 RepID=A0A9P3LF68_9APHY|nr:hypothetical protein PsYK624_094100 [Phanerochaete sordida]